MKPLPNDKQLDELVEMGKVLEEKVKKFGVLAEVFTKKYRKRLHNFKQATIQKSGN